MSKREEPVSFDDDSDDSIASSKTSIASSLYHYRTLFGRSYHHEIGQAEHWAPVDNAHADTLELNHYASILLTDGKLYLAPIKPDAKKVLEIGTGTGLWAIDFAEAHPNTEVIATDIAPIQPTWSPPNVKFQIDDANLDWTWQDNTFDFIYLRYMVGTISDWNKFYREAFRVCKPGGWIEHYEISAIWTSTTPVPEDSPLSLWGKMFTEGGKKLGRSFTVIEDDIQIEGIKAAGFVDMVVKDFVGPLDDHTTDPKMQEVGKLLNLAVHSDLEGYVTYIYGVVLGWSQEEIASYLRQLRIQTSDKSLHTFCRRRIVYARKPE